MRIGFDAKRAFNNSSGLGNYGRQIIDSLTEIYPSEEYLLYTPKTKLDYHPSGNTKIIQPTGLLKGILSSLWRSYKIPELLNNQNVQIYHGLSNELPFGIKKFKGAKVVTIHDVIFLKYPELYRTHDRKIYEAKWKYACGNADKIIAISTQTKNDLIEYLNAEENKIQVIAQDCLSVYHQPNSEENIEISLKKYTQTKPYFISVGTIEERKDQLAILRAWHKTGLGRDIDLIFIGKATPYKEELIKYISKHSLENYVRFLKVESNEDLARLYAGAIASIYVSKYEGFGLPILESMNQGTPVIISDSSCLPETAGEAGIIVPKSNTNVLADQMTLIASDEKLRLIKKAEGLKQAQKFRKENTITQLMQLYQSLM